MDYKNGKIYKITNDVNDEVYVGHTTQTLMQRFSWHIYDRNCKSKHHQKLYALMNELGTDRFCISLIEEYPCENKTELRLREGHWIREIGTLNNREEGRDSKKRYQDNKEQKLQKSKQYYENNKEKISEKTKKYREDNKEKVVERKKKHYENNKEHFAEYKKQWREENKDIISQKRSVKIQCNCGSVVTKRNISTHCKSKKHLTWEATQGAATN